MAHISPKEQYTRMCATLACNVNSRVMQELPDTLEALNAVKKLDFSRSMLGRSDVGPLVQAILRHCSSLQVLNLSQNYLTDSSIVDICETLLANSLLLVSLDLSNNPLSNRTGQYLSRFIYSMPSLRYIGVQKTLMNDSMMKLFPQSRKKVPPSLTGKRSSTLSTGIIVSASDISSMSKDSCSSSLQETAKDDTNSLPKKTHWPALLTLWRAAAVAAPNKNNYSSLSTLISSTHANVKD